MLFPRAVLGFVVSRVVLTAAAPASSSNITWVDCAKHVPDPATNFDAAAVNLSALPASLHCGKLVVPVDYTKPISAQNNITLGLAVYRPSRSEGALFFCPGGTDPGVAAIWQLALNQTGPFMPDFSGLKMYDILAMDIRGTWSSNQLNVSLDVFAGILGAWPSNETQYNAIKATSSQMFESFFQSTQPSALVRHSGTYEVVQDYESIRQALNYEQIHFLGVSYGTYRAAQYAATYPQRVGNFVLDAIIPHGLNLHAQAKYDMLAGNRGLLRADADCQSNTSCPFHADGKGSVPKAYNEIVAALQNSTVLTPAAFQFTFLQSIIGQPVFPELNEQFYGLVSGGAGALAGGGSSGIGLPALVGIPYTCADTSFNNTWAGFEESSKETQKLDSLHIGQTSSQQTMLFCSGWKYPTVPLKKLILKKPMLYVTADFDVGTPTEKATWMWKNHGKNNSVLVVRHGDDHVSWNLPNASSTEITKQFLRTGVLPKARNDTLVTIYEPGMERAPVPNPYDVPTGYIEGDCTDPSVCNLV